MPDKSEALPVLKQLIAFNPDDFGTLALAGSQCRNLDEPFAARDYFRRALAIKARAPTVLSQLAAIQVELGDVHDAHHLLTRLLEIEPQNANAHVRRAMLKMLMGDVDGGLAEYEWRLSIPEDRPEGLPNLRPARLPGRAWKGESLAGKTLFFWCEQGLGDTLQCMRFLPDLLRQRPAAIIGQMPPRLHALMRLNFPSVQLLTAGDPVPPADFYCEMMSLMALVGRQAGREERGQPYIVAPKEEIDQFRVRLSAYAGLKIGLAWAGNSHHKDDKNRSISEEFLRPLFRQQGCQFFGLQLSQQAATRALVGEGMIDLSSDVSNMAATAAAISALDLIVTVDSSLAHLAGALGRPVITLLAQTPDWRWGLEGTGTPLYRSMYLARQKARREWAGVIEEVVSLLAVKRG